MKQYPAVAIITAGSCCSAVKSLMNAKRLVFEAPSLPLPDCSMPQQCRCRFRKYADRRSDDEDRRLLGTSYRAVWYAGEERRKLRPRRTGP
jgi:hypothetical protein